MAFATVNGQPVISAVIAMPLVGAATIDIVVDSQEAISGTVDFATENGLRLSCTTKRSEIYLDSVRILAVLGKGGLQTTAKAQHYESTSLGAVLGDLLSAAGEKLDATASQAALSSRVESWTTATLSVGRLISRLVRSAAPTTSWRFLPAGTFWIGQETWPDSGLDPDDYQIVSEDPENASAVVGVDTIKLLPGMSLGGRHIAYVEHHIEASKLRTRVWFDDDGDRLHAALGAVVRGAVVPVDYHALYLGRVVGQDGTTVDVQPDDDRIPSMSGVPLLFGSPGESVTMAGGRVLIGWSGGDPARKFAVGFDSNTSALKVTFTAAQVFVGGEDGAEPPPLGITYRAAEATKNGQLAAAATALAAAATGPLAPLAAAFGQMAAAWQAFEGQSATFLAKAAMVK